VAAAQFTGLGWYIATAIVLPTLVGVWLDDKAGTAPLFILTGVILGVVVAFYGTYKMASGYLTGRSGSHDDDRTRG
jgi:F0F1-type ATP synthase assembly protein I